MKDTSKDVNVNSKKNIEALKKIVEGVEMVDVSNGIEKIPLTPLMCSWASYVIVWDAEMKENPSH